MCPHSKNTNKTNVLHHLRRRKPILGNATELLGQFLQAFSQRCCTQTHAIHTDCHLGRANRFRFRGLTTMNLHILVGRITIRWTSSFYKNAMSLQERKIIISHKKGGNVRFLFRAKKKLLHKKKLKKESAFQIMVYTLC